MVDPAALKDCAEEAWQQYDSFEGKDVVVDPSIPILYFGDLDGYSRSEVKIVTVGLNPSNREFPDGNEKKRFDHAHIGEGYLDTLNEYFGKNPLRSWFDNYDQLLQGLDASYYSEKENTALHTDLCSPLATKQTWNDLSDETQGNLISEGRPLWKDLIDQLAPDLIIASVAYEHLVDLAEERSVIDIGACEAVYVITEKVNGSARKRPYPVLAWPYDLSNSETASIVYAKAMTLPLGGIGHDQKQEVGEQLTTLL